jgi:hypothetical protein
VLPTNLKRFLPFLNKSLENSVPDFPAPQNIFFFFYVFRPKCRPLRNTAKQAIPVLRQEQNGHRLEQIKSAKTLCSPALHGSIAACTSK